MEHDKIKKVGICGVYGDGPAFFGGQPVKVNTYIRMFEEHMGRENVMLVNTFNWKRNPFKLLMDCFILAKETDSIFVLPAHNGVKIFVPLFLCLKSFFHFKLYYVVIGGWLPDITIKNERLKNLLKRLDLIIVETRQLYEELDKQKFDNVFVIPNAKYIIPIEKSELKRNTSKPFKIVYFSRVMKEKGVEDIIRAVISVNTNRITPLCCLDIYGPIADDYKKKFGDIMDEVPDFISYCGCVNPRDSVNTLKEYDMQAFPTQFKTEGVPGSIVDSYAAGVPVLASRWNSFKDVVIDEKTGIGYKFNDYEDLCAQLNKIVESPEIIDKMRKNCLEFFEENFLPDNVYRKVKTALKWD